jgi:DNA mismatch repair protein MLH3
VVETDTPATVGHVTAGSGMSADIQPLPEPTRERLRSTQILTSLMQLVSELVQNSLDAGARHIEVGLDCEDWSCWVKDNGYGINKEDLLKLGKGRYSK